MRGVSRPASAPSRRSRSPSPSATCSPSRRPAAPLKRRPTAATPFAWRSPAASRSRPSPSPRSPCGGPSCRAGVARGRPRRHVRPGRHARDPRALLGQRVLPPRVRARLPHRARRARRRRGRSAAGSGLIPFPWPQAGPLPLRWHRFQRGSGIGARCPLQRGSGIGARRPLLQRGSGPGARRPLLQRGSGIDARRLLRPRLRRPAPGVS